MVHELKILPQYFDAVRLGYKSFELRKDDRDYRVGDILLLKEWNGKEYTGDECCREVGYIFHRTGEYGLANGYCILGLKRLHKPVDIDKELRVIYESGRT